MTINDQIKDEKLQYDINREAAKISVLSSGKLHKYEYLTGEHILPSSQQQIIEQTKFTNSPLGKPFEKQIKTIEDQGQKQVDALEKLKPEETKQIKDTSKDASFYEYMDSKELFNAIKNSQIKFREAKNKQNEFLNKLSDVKIGKKTPEQKEVINNLENFCKSREEVINSFREYVEMLSDANYNAKQDETKGKGYKILTPEQMLQRLPIALAQVKAGNNSENLLNGIRQIIYLLYQSKEITKKVYNNLMKSL